MTYWQARALVPAAEQAGYDKGVADTLAMIRSEAPNG
jgi:hypothetical protein